MQPWPRGLRMPASGLCSTPGHRASAGEVGAHVRWRPVPARGDWPSLPPRERDTGDQDSIAMERSGPAFVSAPPGRSGRPGPGRRPHGQNGPLGFQRWAEKDRSVAVQGPWGACGKTRSNVAVGHLRRFLCAASTHF